MALISQFGVFEVPTESFELAESHTGNFDWHDLVSSAMESPDRDEADSPCIQPREQSATDGHGRGKAEASWLGCEGTVELSGSSVMPE